MGYGVPGKLRKGVALAVSIALVICAVPAGPVFAAGTTNKIVKQVNFCVFDETTKAVLSISPDFQRKKNIADGEVKEQNPINGTQWIYATEGSTDSMDAKVKGNKIILTKGYGEKESYSGCNITAEHKKAVDVLSNATDVTAIISTKDNEILYYGNLDEDASVAYENSTFKIPAGLEEGNYNLYIFAEDNSAKDTSNTVKTSALGSPVDIEVLSSLEVDITGLDKPEPGEKPDTQAVLKIKKGDNTEEKNINVTWEDEMGSAVEGEFAYNRDYYVYASLEDYIDGYIADITSVKVNGQEATKSYITEGMVTYHYKTRQIADINISGSVGSDNSITLKAYTGITPPEPSPSAAPDTEYIYKWYNPGLDTSEPSYTGQSHVLTQGDFDVTMKVELDTDKQGNAASKEIDILGGLLKTSVIEGVTKTDETVKGKADGIIEGLESGMSYSLDGGNTYSQCTTSQLENLAAGTTCRIKIEKNNLIPAGVTGIYADYIIGEGSGLSVSFDSDGGNGINAIEGVAYNSTITEPAQPVKAGYTFEGWYNSVNNVQWDFGKDKITQNISLIAKWNKNQAVNPDNTTEPDNTTNPGGTTQPGGTQTPSQPAETPGGTQTPVQTATAVPGGTTQPGGTQNPAQPTQTPEGTQTAAPSKNPPAGNNFIPGYIPQGTQQVQTTAPVQTQEPEETHTAAPAQTQTPGSTAEPGNTQQPEQGEPVQTQTPEGTHTAAPEPGSNPSQVPSGENNTGDNGNNATDGTGATASPVQTGTKIVTGGAEYKVSGDGSATISGMVATNKKNIEIPGTVSVNGVTYKVTKIEAGAFANAKKLTTVTIPSSVKTIGAGAFKNCKKLTTVNLPSSLTVIDKGAFQNCKELTKVKIPSSVKTIGQSAFKNCEKIIKVNLPLSVKTIGKDAFKNCKKLKRVVVGKKENNNKKETRQLALRYGTNVAKVSIGASAFENCTDLRSVVINSQVTKIGNSTFKYCSQLRKMLVKSLKLQKVGNQALKGVSNCKITVPPVKLKPYTTLFKNKGQGKKVVVAKS